MQLTEFDFELPPERIAQEPVSPRDHSKLMVLNPQGGLEHRRFYELGDYLKVGDRLVLNATKVFPARLRGKKRSGGKVEVLLLKPLTPALSPGERGSLSNFPSPLGRGSKGEGVIWSALVRGTTQAAAELVFPDGLTARLEERLENGEWLLRFSHNSIRSYLEQHGEMPLPPYIKRSGKSTEDTARYQTVFAQTEGAVAAPTAGFHFTESLLTALREKGVHIVEIVLHVGWGTFRPVRADRVEDHQMLPESYQVDETAAAELTRARAEGHRILAVGTTAVRTLESIYDPETARYRSSSGETNLFVYPGYGFKAIDGLLTNFHLPHSTPLFLASAFYAHKHPGQSPFALRDAYAQAIAQNYRFYSYGDAMLML